VTAGGGDFACNLLTCCLVQVNDAHCRTLVGKEKCCSTANTASAPRNDSRLAMELLRGHISPADSSGAAAANSAPYKPLRYRLVAIPVFVVPLIIVHPSESSIKFTNKPQTSCESRRDCFDNPYLSNLPLPG
jgi:hypothetical protein